MLNWSRLVDAALCSGLIGELCMSLGEKCSSDAVPRTLIGRGFVGLAGCTVRVQIASRPAGPTLGRGAGAGVAVRPATDALHTPPADAAARCLAAPGAGQGAEGGAARLGGRAARHFSRTASGSVVSRQRPVIFVPQAQKPPVRGCARSWPMRPKVATATRKKPTRLNSI